MDRLDTPDFDHYPITVLPVELTVSESELLITWEDGHRSCFPLIMLRDFSPDLVTFSLQTREQNISILDIPDSLSVTEAEICDDGFISLKWLPECLVSRYHPGWLRVHCPTDPKPQFTLPDIKLWPWGLTHIPVSVPADQIQQPAGMTTWLNGIHRDGAARITGLPQEPAALADVVTAIGPVRESNFGSFFEVISRPDADSNAYTAQALAPHTDLATREYQPGLQFLFCLANQTTGGDNILVDGYAVADMLKQTSPDDYELLSSTLIPFMSRGLDTEYRYHAPLLEHDRHGKICTIRFTYWLRSPMSGNQQKIAAFYRAYRRFHEIVNDPANQIRFRLQPGDLIGFDNRRVLHGRTSFDPESGDRWLRGCYLDREELESRLRILSRNLRAQQAG